MRLESARSARPEAPYQPLIDQDFISADAGNGWAACYRLVNGKVRQHGRGRYKSRW